MATSDYDILCEALDDEYKAMATYNAVIATFGPVRPFVNIVEAEARHAQALLGQFDRLAKTPPPDRWTGKVTAPASIADACAAAVQGEIANAAMYDRLIENAADLKIRRVLENLREASQERHLPAFKRCVKGGRGQRQRGGRGRGQNAGHGAGQHKGEHGPTC